MGEWVPQAGGEEVYSLYRRGMSLLESGDFAQAAVPLSRAARLAPEKTSIREALGRAYFHTRRFGEAAREFQAVVDRYPVNDFAQFCLGRSLSRAGECERGRHHLAIAVGLRPERSDYRIFRERERRRAAGD